MFLFSHFVTHLDKCIRSEVKQSQQQRGADQWNRVGGRAATMSRWARRRDDLIEDVFPIT